MMKPNQEQNEYEAIEKKQLEALIPRYAAAIHTGEKENFLSLFSSQLPCHLISIGTVYTGIDSIYQDFLVGGIHAAYECIDLIVEQVDINLLDRDHAIVIFRYHTETIRRDTKEHYGIRGVETWLCVKEEGAYSKEEKAWKIVHLHYSKE